MIYFVTNEKEPTLRARPQVIKTHSAASPLSQMARASCLINEM